MISAIRKSGESNWEGTPSKRFLDQVERKQESKDDSFFEAMRQAIIAIDQRRNKVWFSAETKREL